MKTIEQPQTALEAHNLIKQYCGTEFQETRFIDNVTSNEYPRQGDLYIVRIDNWIEDYHVEVKTRQLAPGTTQGSRHILVGEAQVFAPKNNSTPDKTSRGYMLKGMVFLAKGFVTIEHPEHAHISLPAGTYQVCHQVDVRTMKRVID